MASEVYPLFRPYSIAIRDWLRSIIRIPRYERSVFEIQSLIVNGTADGGVNQHEVHLDVDHHPFKPGHIVQIYDTSHNDDYYSIEKIEGNILILDQNYRRLRTTESGIGSIKRAVNVIYGNMERSIAMIAQPLRNGLVDSPGVSFYITDYQYKIEKSRPPENFYVRRYKDNNVGSIVGVASVPPLLEYQVHYNINLWAVYQQEMDIISYQVVSEFNPEKFFWIGDDEFGFQYNGDRMNRQYRGQWAHSLVDAISDVSDLEPGDATQRALRTEIGFMVTNAYLPQPFESDQPIIGSIDIETIMDEKL